MREIRFRAWDRIKKEMFDIWEINFKDKKVKLGYLPPTPHGARERDFSDVELMQYIGRKDVNGVEIYEGDIIKYIGEEVEADEMDIFVVKFEDGFFFYESQEDREYDSAVSIFPIEVIGNIYENPELLEAK